METDNNSPERPIVYYGKKVYYINPLIAKKVVPPKKEPDYRKETVEDDRDK
jgi:hypothetical protein